MVLCYNSLNRLSQQPGCDSALQFYKVLLRELGKGYMESQTPALLPSHFMPLGLSLHSFDSLFLFVKWW
jgi:hypothetical protein